MRSSGFTLIEVLIVVLILGILATFALPQFEAMRWRARYAEVFMVVGAISRAQQLYRLEYGVYADINNSGDECQAGNGKPTGGTKIQRQLGVEISSDSFFTYLVYPGNGHPDTNIYFRDPLYDWAWVYDYSNKIWYQYNPGSGGPAQKYFRPPS